MGCPWKYSGGGELWQLLPSSFCGTSVAEARVVPETVWHAVGCAVGTPLAWGKLQPQLGCQPPLSCVALLHSFFFRDTVPWNWFLTASGPHTQRCLYLTLHWVSGSCCLGRVQLHDVVHCLLIAESFLSWIYSYFQQNVGFQKLSTTAQLLSLRLQGRSRQHPISFWAHNLSTGWPPASRGGYSAEGVEHYYKLLKLCGCCRSHCVKSGQTTSTHLVVEQGTVGVCE